jgi:hypothetical protein
LRSPGAKKAAQKYSRDVRRELRDEAIFQASSLDEPS